jgi:hypothetical protein
MNYKEEVEAGMSQWGPGLHTPKATLRALLREQLQMDLQPTRSINHCRLLSLGDRTKLFLANKNSCITK